jgi:hypothetical protein
MCQELYFVKSGINFKRNDDMKEAFLSKSDAVFTCKTQ